MGSGLPRTGAETKQMLLKAARRRIAKHGPDGLKIADVARDAGVSHPLVLHHFGSRDGLVTELVNDVAERISGVLIKMMASSSADSPGFVPMLDRASADLSDEGYAELLVWALRERPEQVLPRIEQILATLIDEGHALRVRYLPTSLDAERLRSDTARIIVLSAIFLIGEGLIGQTLSRAGGIDDPAQVRALFAKLLALRLLPQI
jgi:AcrR family transcriptional regulator